MSALKQHTPCKFWHRTFVLVPVSSYPWNTWNVLLKIGFFAFFEYAFVKSVSASRPTLTASLRRMSFFSWHTSSKSDRIKQIIDADNSGDLVKAIRSLGLDVNEFKVFETCVNDTRVSMFRTTFHLTIALIFTTGDEKTMFSRVKHFKEAFSVAHCCCEKMRLSFGTGEKGVFTREILSTNKFANTTQVQHAHVRDSRKQNGLYSHSLFVS